jgi:hypothetical protein
MMINGCILFFLNCDKISQIFCFCSLDLTNFDYFEKN